MVPALPLPRTLAAAALLTLIPAVLLSRWSRPRAQGLEQLMGSASLIQSFAVTPDRPVPPLWKERLGPVAATRLWQRQRRVWWQLWANQSESSPYLVLELSGDGLPKASLPPSALRVGDLLVLAEDTIARRQLAQSLRPLQRSRAGLPRLCLSRLQSGQAVYWNGAALGEIVGPVAPLLERYQVGCLSLALEGGALRWQGEAAASEGRLGLLAGASTAGPAGGSEAAGPISLQVPELPSLVPLPEAELLELQGASLDPLLRGLLQRPIIRDPLASRYGLEGRRLEAVSRKPFRLRLRPRSSGPFQAGLELQLVVGESKAIWKPVLEKISASLQAQGYMSGAQGSASPPPGAAGPKALPSDRQRSTGTPSAAPPSAGPGPAAPPASPASSSAPAASSGRGAQPVPPPSGSAGRPVQPLDSGTTLWRRADGVVVGGWIWIPDPGRTPQLLLFLGPTPAASAPMPLSDGQRPGPGQLWMRLRPNAMAAIGLLPQRMPTLLQKASQVWIESEPLASPSRGEPISRLRGRLQLSR